MLPLHYSIHLSYLVLFTHIPDMCVYCCYCLGVLHDTGEVYRHQGHVYEN